MAQEFIDVLDGNTSHKYVEHVCKVEEVYRVADALVEEDIECNLIDSDSDQDQEIYEDMYDEDDDNV